IRGDFLRTGDIVSSGTPAALSIPGDTTSSNATSQSRHDLARWLIDRRNPLTSRVTVNRIWARYFGLGIVETENDFGLQGTPPSHPELLDWLSSEFMGGGWSMKRLHRLIVESATYRQSSKSRTACEVVDSRNRLLFKQNRLRVDAEIVRDVCLAVSGLFHEKLGGPSVYPPQPEGIYAFTQRQASWPTSTGPNRYRRGMYTFFMRSAPYPMLTIFDVPRFNTTCTLRIRSNTPLQSLTLANDESMVEFSQAMGSEILNTSQDDQQRIQRTVLICLARLPDDFERHRLIDFVTRQRSDFTTSLDDAVAVGGLTLEQALQASNSSSSAESNSATTKFNAEKRIVEQAVWTSLARILMNLDEFITRE
ncbi:MAG: DUF1553 domain-containing protein, partial [Planctomycetes bacterium]|nr:DUF1553 domain-containing protein [Planctomycetota bacterium]